MDLERSGRRAPCSAFGCALVVALCVQWTGGAAFAEDAKTPYYTEEQIYKFRPDPGKDEILFGNVGVTGLLIDFHKGVVATVDRALPDTPAAGKFSSGQIITGVNGVKLRGRNPIVVLGKALTGAEAADGVLVFDVKDDANGLEKQVKITIPVLGEYGDKWPLGSEKSRRIIHDAAEFYSTDKSFKREFFAEKGIGGALACLFLLSTGQDKYLPRVKEYFQQFPPDVTKIGNITWDNGYNGIACAEYYLRTGDRSVLPILQYYCDDAKLRQSFGCGWGHWGFTPNPGYVAGGLMNPAGAQVLTTLLLAKECGLKVDDRTLLGSLRFFYRFAGKGTVPYGDHRGEGGLGSNGKDGMIAAAMQIASGAGGDVTLYKQANRHLGMSMVLSYPVMAQGHGDDGRGDGIWRGIASAYIMDDKPEIYHAAMGRLAWFYDLCRRPSGGFGMAVVHEFDEPGSGAGVALAYTAPLKTLQITGAPRSKYAKTFSLPEDPWGRKADAAFLSIEKNPKYATFGEPEPVHVPFYKFGSAYSKPAGDLKAVPVREMVRNVYHDSYMIRAQAAKAMRKVGAFAELEKLLDEPDPRVRRAALDGLIDYNYWFAMGREPIATEDLSPKMSASIKRMIADPDESLWVVDGALMALGQASPEEINECLPVIMQWLDHEDWWLRESAFTALYGLRKNEKLFAKVLPAMLNMATREYHTQPRERCMDKLGRFLDDRDGAGPTGQRTLAGLLEAVEKTEIKPDRGSYNLSAEGAYNAKMTIETYLRKAPQTGLQTARMMRTRLPDMGAADIIDLIGSPNSNREGRPYGLYSTLDVLKPEQRQELIDILYNDYRPELTKRLKAATEDREALTDTIIDLLNFKHPDAGWRALGDKPPAERTWRYLSFNPQPNDAMHPREKKRFRDVTMPIGLARWYAPDFDDSAWKSGKAPIGIGVFKGRGGTTFANRSAWGDGEFLLMRTTFTLDDLDWDYVRISVLAKQGYNIYLNGQPIQTYIWWKDMPHYRKIILDSAQTRYLKKGVNSLAVYTNVEYGQGETLGQADVFLEGLKKEDLARP
jgi:hypothetical protein